MCNEWTKNKRNKFILSYLFLGLWLHVETNLIVLSDVQKYNNNSPFSKRIYCLCVWACRQELKRGRDSKFAEIMCTCISGSTRNSDYNKQQSSHCTGFISVIPHTQLVCLFLDQILKLLGSSVQKTLRLRLWNIITLLISAGRCQ